MTDLAEMIDVRMPKPGKRGPYKKRAAALVGIVVSYWAEKWIAVAVSIFVAVIGFAADYIMPKKIWKERTPG